MQTWISVRSKSSRADGRIRIRTTNNNGSRSKRSKKRRIISGTVRERLLKSKKMLSLSEGRDRPSGPVCWMLLGVYVCMHVFSEISFLGEGTLQCHSELNKPGTRQLFCRYRTQGKWNGSYGSKKIICRDLFPVLLKFGFCRASRLTLFFLHSRKTVRFLWKQNVGKVWQNLRIFMHVSHVHKNLEGYFGF
jgi:hypothetical protein